MAADAVHKAMEDSVPALEYYYARKVFTREEVKDIVKTRTEIEYQLHGPHVSLPVVLEAINYERRLERLRKKRVPRTPLKNRFDNHIVQRIEHLFDRCRARLNADDRIRLAHEELDFLASLETKAGDRKQAQVLGKLLQENPGRADVCVYAARWELEHHHSIDNARAILHRGLRNIPDSVLLWKEYFGTELRYWGTLVDKLKEGVEEQEELSPKLRAVLRGDILKVVHSHAMKKHKGAAQVDLTLEMLQQCEAYSFTAHLQNHLGEWLMKHHPDNPRCIAAVAILPFLHSARKMRSIRDLTGIDLDEEGTLPEDRTEEETAALLKKTLEGMVDGLGKAADVKGTADAVLRMCDKAVRTAYDITSDERLPELLGSLDLSGSIHPYTSAALAVVEAMASAVSRGKLAVEEATFLRLSAILVRMGRAGLAEQVLQVATAANPTSVALWVKAAELKMARGDDTGPLLVEALQSVGRRNADAWPVWVAFLQYLAFRSSTPFAPSPPKRRARDEGVSIDSSLQAASQEALKVAAGLPLGPPRDKALEKVGGVVLLLLPREASGLLQWVHKMPESLALQWSLTVLNNEQAKSRETFTKLLQGPAGLSKSALLWALWIEWEMKRGGGVTKSNHVRTLATKSNVPTANIQALQPTVSQMV